MDRISMIKEVFEGYKILTYKDFIIKLYNALKKEGLNLNGLNSFVENACCRDDNQYGKPLMLTRRLGLGYPFGGQTFGGYPIEFGRDGLIPQEHHIPNLTEEQYLIILNASHVGLDNKGRWGRAERYNMKDSGASCGYLMNILKSDEFISDNWEMEQIYRILEGDLKKVKESKIPEVEIAKLVADKAKQKYSEYIIAAGKEEPNVTTIYINGVNVDLYPNPEDDEKNIICVNCVEIYNNGEKIKDIEL